MSWPFVSRARYEALEDKLDAADVRYRDLEARYDELKKHADRLLESVLGAKQAPEEEPEKPQTPRRPLGRDIVAMANAAAYERNKLEKKA